MNEFLSSFSALPNLHPAVVHFPIALALTAIALDIISLIFRKFPWLEKAAVLLYVLSLSGAAVAYIAGKEAADSLGTLSARTETVLANHADLALLTLIFLALAMVIRLISFYKSRSVPLSRLSPLRVLGMIIMIAGSGLVVRTADLGGSLVYRHGVSVSIKQRKINTARVKFPSNTQKKSILIKEGNGAISWNPSWGDTQALGKIVKLLPGSSPISLVDNKKGTSPKGLFLKISGTSILVFRETFKNFTAKVNFDFSRFEGTKGLAFQLKSLKKGVFFTINNNDQAKLELRKRNMISILDSNKIPYIKDKVTMAISSIGNHLKGFIDNKMIVHGHTSSLEVGQFGLIFKGNGTVGIISVKIIPAEHS